LLFRVAVFCGNDEALGCEDLPLPPSFPQKWESRNEKQQEFIGNDRNCPKLNGLDSRLRGNDGISVAAKSIKKGHMP
jgi:hypothetical protein